MFHQNPPARKRIQPGFLVAALVSAVVLFVLLFYGLNWFIGTLGLTAQPSSTEPIPIILLTEEETGSLPQ